MISNKKRKVISSSISQLLQLLLDKESNGVYVLLILIKQPLPMPNQTFRTRKKVMLIKLDSSLLLMSNKSESLIKIYLKFKI